MPLLVCLEPACSQICRVKELTSIIEDATSAIDRTYWRLPVDGGDPIYRERVYSYELYHQMRKRWPEHCPWVLNGEVDKSGHPLLLPLGADGTIPDLLVHRPGSMAGNHAIIEVKPVTARPNRLLDDIKKLCVYRSKVRYQRAILLVYGDGADTCARNLCGGADQHPAIELWAHHALSQPARCVGIIGGIGVD